MKFRSPTRRGRRAGALCLAAALLCASLSACGGSDVTIARMAEAGGTAQLLQLHESFRIKETSYTERPSRVVYIDRELGFVDSDGTQTLCYDGAPDYQYYSDVYSGYLYAGTEKTAAPRYASELYDAVYCPDEVITGLRRTGEKLFVSTELPAERSAALFARDGYPAREGDRLTCTYALEPKTLSPLAAYVNVTSTDGTITAYYRAAVTYDVARPANLESLLEHTAQTDDMRTVCLVLAPDTGQEQSVSRLLPKGDGFVAVVPDGAALWLDRACTKPFTGEPDWVDDEEDEDAEPRQDDLTIFVSLPQ